MQNKTLIHLILATTLLSLLTFAARAQGEIDEQETIVLRNERTYGLTLNSNGAGFGFRFAKRIDGYKKRLYTAEFNTIKHPKEIKVIPYYNSTSRFVYGKENFAFNLKGGWGFQKEVYSKHDKGGLSIRYFYTVGPTISVLKPIYYEVYNLTAETTNHEKFNENISMYEIIGKSSFIRGMDEISFVPGASFKLGTTFEYSKRDDVFSALEAGVVVEAYMNKIRIMASNDNQQFFLNLFISYRFGKVIETRL